MLSVTETLTNYEQAMAIIETCLAKRSAKLTEADLVELQRLSMLVERYRDTHFPMPVDADSVG